MKKIQKKIWTALLSRTGMLRIPKELLPERVKGKTLSFFLMAFPVSKELRLTPSFDGNFYGAPMRKALYANAAARSPQVCVMSALRFLQVQPKKKSEEFPIRRLKDGVLVVQF